MLRRTFVLLTLTVLAMPWATSAERPNILWITSEDNGPQLGAYGDSYADTPNLDALAERSLRYRVCWSNAPVCAPARTTLISGMYATSLGGQHMRSGVRIPDSMRLYPEVFRDAGYYCTNNSKTDYNLKNHDAGWHDSSKKAHWRNRPDNDTPFLSVFNSTISHESKIRVRPHTLVHDPAKAPVPSYHPDTPEVRHDWAQYYDKMTEMDSQLGKVLDELREDGLEDSTIVFYYGDHGSGMPRSKRWPFNSGLHVPLIVHIPEKFRDLRPADYAAGGQTDRLAAFVDLAPTALSACGIEPPEVMQGVPLFGRFEAPPKPFVFGFRGRMDERRDMVRSCTDGRYVYLRHFYPDRPYLKYVAYMFQTPTTRVWKEMFDRGELNAIQAKVWQPKPIEELFDLRSDPDETINLATDPAFAEQTAKMRGAVKQWMIDVNDLGVLPEDLIHGRAPKLSPFAAARESDWNIRGYVEAAFDSLSTATDDHELIDRLTNDDPVIRFWATRGLAIRRDENPLRIAALSRTMDDPDGNVAVAAADGLLASGNETQKQSAIDRLLQLADANRTSQYIAIDALNVLDMNAELSEQQLDQVAKLPRAADPAPARAEKYVENLLDHLVPADR